MTYIKLGFVNTAATNESPETQAAKLADAGYKMQREGSDVEPFLPFLREGDTIAVSRIQRLAPNLTALRKVTDILNEAGVTLRVLDLDINTATLEGKRALDLILTYEKEEAQTQKPDPQSDRQNDNPKAEVIKPVQMEMFQNMPVPEKPKPPVVSYKPFLKHEARSNRREEPYLALNWNVIGLLSMAGWDATEIASFTKYKLNSVCSALKKINARYKMPTKPVRKGLAAAYMVKAGVPCSEVAQRLGVTTSTVYFHVRNTLDYPRFTKGKRGRMPDYRAAA